MISITKKYNFEASHYLPYYKGDCHNLHGHSYKVEVTICGNVKSYSSNRGMILDFKELKKILDKEVGKYDHKNLNDFFENPTAELIATQIGLDVSSYFIGTTVILKSVRVWETEDSYAEYFPDDYR